jgi:hypothetical protein
MKTDAETLKEVDEILSEFCPEGTTVEKARFVTLTIRNAGSYIHSLDSTVAADAFARDPLPPEELKRETL